MKRLQEAIARRKRELDVETKEIATRHVTGRKMTDKSAMARPAVARAERRARAAPFKMAKMSVFQAEDSSRPGLELDEGEVSDRVAQSDILATVDAQTKQKKFDLVLEQMGPYTCDFSLNGTDVVLAGLRGHVAAFRWQEFKLEGEVQLKDKVTDCKFIVDGSMYALAQKRFVYMYTKAGVEMHILQNMANCDKIEYLPNHMLLCASSSQYSVLHYMDVSTGKTVASKSPAQVKDPTVCLKRNPANGILATGDLRGVLKLWSPTVEDPVVQLKVHKGAVKDVVFHPDGRFAVTLGVDSKFKIWDLRTLRPLESYSANYSVDSMDISAKGIVAIGGGTGVHLWRDLFTKDRARGPFLKHSIGYGNIVNKLQYCPFEDVLGIGHSRGFSTMIVPGAGDPNPDFFKANPYETEAHRKQRVVSTLLDKLPPDTISMDLQIAGVDEDRLKEYNEKLQQQRRIKHIREKRKPPQSVAEPIFKANPEDEIDEDLGVKEGGVSKLWRPKKEIQKERKMAAWQKKDSSDKVRSKQTMRSSKIAKVAKTKMAADKIVKGTEAEINAAGKKWSLTKTQRQKARRDEHDAGRVAHVTEKRSAAKEAANVKGTAPAMKELSEDAKQNAAFRRFR